MANPSGTLEAAELDRGNAQRKALAGLLARFTADRDVLITAVQACEQRVEALAARLDAGAVGTAAAEGQPVAVHSPAETEALRVLIDQLRRDHQDAIAQARKTAEHATFRADAALRSIEELDSTAPSARNENTGALFARFTADRDSLMAAVAECQERLTALAARLDAVAAGTLPATSAAATDTSLVEALQQSINTLRAEQQHAAAEARRLAETATARADEAVRTIERLAPTPRTDEQAGALQATMQAGEERVAALIEQVHTAQRDTETRLDATRDHAFAQSHEALQRIDELAARTVTDRAALIDLVRGSEQRLAALAARLDAVESNGGVHLGAIIERIKQIESGQQLATQVATQQPLDEHLAALVQRAAADHEILVGLQHEFEQQRAAVAAHPNGAGDSPQLHEIRQRIEQLQAERESEARVRSAAGDAALRSRETNKADLAAMRSTLRHLTGSVRRLDGQVQQIETATAGAPPGAIADLVARLAAIETAFGALPPPADAAKQRGSAPAQLATTARNPAAGKPALAKSEGIGQRVAHAALSAYRQGGTRISSAWARAPLRRQVGPPRSTVPDSGAPQPRRRDRAAIAAAVLVLGVIAGAGVLQWSERPTESSPRVAPRVSVAASRASRDVGPIMPDHGNNPGTNSANGLPERVFQTQLSVETVFPAGAVLDTVEPAAPGGSER